MSNEEIYKEWRNWLEPFVSLFTEKEKANNILPIYRHRFSCPANLKQQLGVAYTAYETIVCHNNSEKKLDYYSKSNIISQIVSIRHSELKRLTENLSEYNPIANSDYEYFIRIYSENVQIIADEISMLVMHQNKLDKDHKKALNNMTT